MVVFWTDLSLNEWKERVQVTTEAIFLHLHNTPDRYRPTYENSSLSEQKITCNKCEVWKVFQMEHKRRPQDQLTIIEWKTDVVANWLEHSPGNAGVWVQSFPGRVTL